MVTLVVTQELFGTIVAAAHDPVETAGVLLASVVPTPSGDIRLLAREILWVDPNAYEIREDDELVIRSEGYVQALKQAESIGAFCLWLHTHPGDGFSPIPSDRDQKVDDQISELFRLRSGSKYYGAIIFSPERQGVSFTGWVQAEDDTSHPIERIWQVGSRMRMLHAYGMRPEGVGLSTQFNRNIKAFGPAIQETLGDLTVGIVGCGGTGSVVAEQLVRLGVRTVIVIDPKELSASNVTRVYGSTASDVGRPKVAILQEHLLRIAPDLRCQIIQSLVTEETTARSLIGCDIIFGCTDDNAGRMILSRLSSFLLVPVIDCGVLLSSNSESELTGIDGRVTVLYPGTACLICRGRIDLARARAESLPPDERDELVRQGYAPALGDIEPAVVNFTSLVGSFAVTELLERLIGYGIEPPPNEILLRCHDREISTNVVVPKERHFCHYESGKIGAGITEPFLEIAWGAK